MPRELTGTARQGAASCARSSRVRLSPPLPSRLFASPLQLGSTAVGIQVPDGVLLAVEKRITSPLLEPESIEKIMEIDSHLGCSMSGLTADARTLIDHARIETQNHRFTYDTPMTVEATTQSICDLALGFGEGGEKSMVRRYRVPRLAVLLSRSEGRGRGEVGQHGLCLLCL